MSVLFMGFAAMNFATQRDYRSLIQGEDGADGLQTRLNKTRNRVQERQAEIQRTKFRIDLERTARRNALSVLDIRAHKLMEQLKSVQSEYAILAKEQRELNESVKSVQEEIKRLKDEVDTARTDLIATVSERNDQMKQVTELTDRINQGEGVLRRLQERSKQFSGLRSGS